MVFKVVSVRPAKTVVEIIGPLSICNIVRAMFRELISLIPKGAGLT